MRLESTFRFSTSLALGLAALCLGFAEMVFLPVSAWLTVLVAGAIGVAYLLEGRWTLSPRWANTLALLGLVYTMIWIAKQLANPTNSITAFLPLPAALVPYAGPVLLVLQIPLLFRPKQARDCWTLHSIGFIEVVLACVLAGDLIFGILLLAYLAALVWSLTLFYPYREHQTAGPAQAVATQDHFRLGLGSALGRVIVAVVLGFALFVLTPRVGQSQWDTLSLAPGDATQSGFARMIDLNHTGALLMDSRVAFRVYAEDSAGNPKMDLSPEQRWRGATLDFYDRGRWLGRPPARALLDIWTKPLKHGAGSGDLPHLGPEEYFLTFTSETSSDVFQWDKGLFLADPVLRPGTGGTVPVIALSDAVNAKSRVHFNELDWTLIPPFTGRSELIKYQQVSQVPDPSGIYPVDLPFGYLTNLLTGKMPAIRQWSLEVLGRLRAQGLLTEEEITLVPGLERGGETVVSLNHREGVARALTDHLSFSGEYTYTLVNRRQNLQVDPTEDFLVNVKQGHCEQYAAGLVLALRSLGIPARIVNGYRGAESVAEEGSEGWYQVRQSHAHSWVEALLEAPDGRLSWLTLDPSPVADLMRGSGFDLMRLWQRARNLSREAWWVWVIDYHPEQGREAAATIWQGLPHPGLSAGSRTGSTVPSTNWGNPWPWLAVLPGLWLLAWLIRKVRAAKWTRASSKEQTDREAAFYQDWLKVVARRCHLTPSRSQTPREFGLVIEDYLRRKPDTVALADIPQRVVRYFYQVRYGGIALHPTEVQDLMEQVTRAEAMLAPSIVRR
jgi:hypothetical protein